MLCDQCQLNTFQIVIEVVNTELPNLGKLTRVLRKKCLLFLQIWATQQ